MRRHSRLSRYAPPLSPDRVAAILRADRLRFAHLQPPYSSRFESWIDVGFSDGTSFAIVPFVQIDAPMLLVRESSPFLWPQWLDVGDGVLEEVEALLEPWLVSIALLDSVDREIVKFFSPDSRIQAEFAAARAARFLGAAPIGDVFSAAAPYVYAQRFCNQRSVGIRSPDAGYGAALLRASAAAVRADLGAPERNELAARWFGAEIFGTACTPFDVTIGMDESVTPVRIALAPDVGEKTIPVVRPAFPAILCSFDAADADVVGRFSVTAPGATLRSSSFVAAPVIGGSSGRIGLIVRDDGLRAPDADVDEARALREALCTQGFDAALVLASAAQPAAFDLIHAFGHRHAEQLIPLLDGAQRANVPVVLSPSLDDDASDAAWGGAIGGMLEAQLLDEASRGAIQAGLAARMISFTDGAPRGAASFDRNAVGRLFTRANAIVVACDEEAEQLRSRFGYSGVTRTAISPLPVRLPSARLGALTGSDPYVLLHGPLEPRANQAAVVRAAAQLRLPCVIAGSAEDGEYYQNLLSFAGPLAMWLPSDTLDVEDLATLYAGARVFADAGWSGRGPFRTLTAASYGCGLLLSTALPWGALWRGLAETADPASFQSVREALRGAWDRAPVAGPLIAQQVAKNHDPLRSLQAVLGAYAEAAKVSAR